jgi:hypothetical protein
MYVMPASADKPWRIAQWRYCVEPVEWVEEDQFVWEMHWEDCDKCRPMPPPEQWPDGTFVIFDRDGNIQ